MKKGMSARKANALQKVYGLMDELRNKRGLRKLREWEEDDKMFYEIRYRNNMTIAEYEALGSKLEDMIAQPIAPATDKQIGYIGKLCDWIGEEGEMYFKGIKNLNKYQASEIIEYLKRSLDMNNHIWQYSFGEIEDFGQLADLMKENYNN